MPAPRSIPLLAWIAARPGRAFAAFLGLHAAVWTALPTLLYPNLPLDLIEALIYGREWQLGYDKLPPLPWWLVEIAYRLVGHDFAYYLLAQIAVVAGFAFVYLAARPLVGPLGALACRAHHRRPALPQLHRRQVQSRRHPAAVLGAGRLCLSPRAARPADRRTGCCSGWRSGCRCGRNISWWCWRCPLALFVLIDRDARKTLATPGPYIALAAALITMAPHLVWLVRNDFLPFAYAEHRALPSRGLIDHVWHPLQFAISQLFFLIPSLLIALPLFYPRARAGEPPVAASADAFDRRIVTWLAFGPMATVLALSALSGRGTVAMWGYPLWLFLGLWIVLTARRALDGMRLARVLATWAIVFTCLALAFIANYAVLPQFDHRYRAVFFPGGDLGREISQRYRAVTGQTAGLCDRHHVGRRQCRALCAGASARVDRRQAATRAVDRPQRSQEHAARWWCGPPAIFTPCRLSSGPSPPTPRCSRRSCCTTGAATRASMSAGRSCCRGLPTPAGSSACP